MPRPPYLRKGFGLLECDQAVAVPKETKPNEDDDGEIKLSATGFMASDLHNRLVL